MAQQINLCSPILMAPRRPFAARAIAQALGVLTLGLVVLAAWSAGSAARLASDLKTIATVNEAEKARLEAALAQRPVRDPAALEQQLAQARRALTERRALLDTLDPAHGGAGLDNAALLRQLAETAPARLWLTEVRRAEGRIELNGMTQAPDTLRPWLDTLATEGPLRGRTLRAVKVERVESVEGGGEAWRFRVESSRAGGDAS